MLRKIRKLLVAVALMGVVTVGTLGWSMAYVGCQIDAVVTDNRALMKQQGLEVWEQVSRHYDDDVHRKLFFIVLAGAGLSLPLAWLAFQGILDIKEIFEAAEQSEYLERAVNLVKHPMLVIDGDDHTVVFANQEMVKKLGVTSYKAICGKHISELMNLGHDIGVFMRELLAQNGLNTTLLMKIGNIWAEHTVSVHPVVNDEADTADHIVFVVNS